MPKQIKIIYPSVETQVGPYITNIGTKLAGAIGTKYGTDPLTITTINGHATQVPIDIQKAYDDNQLAQNSTAIKDDRLALAKLDTLREMKRITNLPNWDENDGELLGIRQVTTPVDINTVKPVITKVTSLPEQNILDYVRAGMEGVIIYSIVEGTATTSGGGTVAVPDPGSPLWVKIGEDDRSPYEDTRPNQSSHPENRYYMMRYKKNNKPVGLFSSIVKVVTDIHP